VIIEPIPYDAATQTIIPEGTDGSRVENVEVNPGENGAPDGLVVYDANRGDLKTNLDGSIEQVGARIDQSVGFAE